MSPGDRGVHAGTQRRGGFCVSDGSREPHVQGEKTSPGTGRSGEAVRLGEDRAGIPEKAEEGGTALTRLNADVWGSGRPASRGGRPGDGPRSRAPCPPPRGMAPACLLHPTSHISPEPAAATQTGSLLEAGGSAGRDLMECGHGHGRQALLSSTSRHTRSRHGLDPRAKGEDRRVWMSALLDAP